MASAVLVDNGCSSHLLPLQKGELTTIVDIFPPTTHKWNITTSKGVAAATSLTLKVFSKDGSDFKVSLCADMKQDPSKSVFSFEFLQFHLCLEDVQELLAPSNPSHVLFKSLPNPCQGALRDFISSPTPSRQNPCFVGP